MLIEGLDVAITQTGHTFTVSGKDAAQLHAKLRQKQIYKGFTASAIKEDGTFTLERMSASVANA